MEHELPFRDGKESRAALEGVAREYKGSSEGAQREYGGAIREQVGAFSSNKAV